jgi:hypothetical protein
MLNQEKFSLFDKTDVILIPVYVQIPEPLDFQTYLCQEIEWSITHLFKVRFMNGPLA